MVYCVTLANASSTQKVMSDSAIPQAHMASIPWKISYIMYMKVVLFMLLSSCAIVMFFANITSIVMIIFIFIVIILFLLLS